MYCRICGTKIQEGAKFCKICGEPVVMDMNSDSSETAETDIEASDEALSDYAFDYGYDEDYEEDYEEDPIYETEEELIEEELIEEPIEDALHSEVDANVFEDYTEKGYLPSNAGIDKDRIVFYICGFICAFLCVAIPFAPYVHMSMGGYDMSYSFCSLWKTIHEFSEKHSIGYILLFVPITVLWISSIIILFKVLFDIAVRGKTKYRAVVRQLSVISITMLISLVILYVGFLQLLSPLLDSGKTQNSFILSDVVPVMGIVSIIIFTLSVIKSKRVTHVFLKKIASIIILSAVIVFMNIAQMLLSENVDTKMVRYFVRHCQNIQRSPAEQKRADLQLADGIHYAFLWVLSELTDAERGYKPYRDDLLMLDESAECDIITIDSLDEHPVFREVLDCIDSSLSSFQELQYRICSENATGRILVSVKKSDSSFHMYKVRVEIEGTDVVVE
ncbi:MAG: zinc ribbon domain-containing protein [Lachnospiraceae bacterium]|nr:zinc ribbon domain-containing protein [Lachnospiraceae bacterium]